VSELDSGKVERAAAQFPTLSAYYTDAKLKPAPFCKAVRTAKIKIFEPADIESARALIAQTDPDFSRTLALGVGSPPEPIERWVIEAARSAVSAAYSNALLDESSSRLLKFVFAGP
jgi:hypothetical protein